MSGAPVTALRRLLATAPPELPREACQRCGAGLAGEHAHIADVASRALLCVCRACHEAAMRDGPTAGARRAVPRRYRSLPAASFDDEAWDALEIPVGIAFFFRNSALGRSVACYPSPAGATESLLPAESWDRLLEALPATRALEPDVEALLVRRTREASEAFVVPIDACYELVGRIRGRWSGFGAGPEVTGEVDGFFEALRGRSEPGSA